MGPIHCCPSQTIGPAIICWMTQVRIAARISSAEHFGVSRYGRAPKVCRSEGRQHSNRQGRTREDPSIQQCASRPSRPDRARCEASREGGPAASDDASLHARDYRPSPGDLAPVALAVAPRRILGKAARLRLQASQKNRRLRDHVARRFPLTTPAEFHKSPSVIAAHSEHASL